MVMLTNLAQVLRDAGLNVVEVDGWKTRSRPASTGGFEPVGVLAHHTVTGKSTPDRDVVSLLIHGRPDLPGPLSQLGLARDGTFYVIAAGRANHAGTAKASGTVGAGDGNRLYVGIEGFNNGTGEPWPAAQYDAFVRGAAAISEKITGNSADTVRGHKETTVTGKIDPTFDMRDFRERVAAALDKDDPKPPPEIPTQPLGPANLTTGTFNLGGGPTEAKIGDLLRLLKTCDIIGLQEAGDRQDVLKQLEAAGFLIDRGDDTPGASSVPIVVNETRIEAVRGYTLELAPRMVTRGWPESLRRTVAKVSRKPAGPKWVKRKVLNVVVVEHADGRRIHFANTHLPASIWHPGRRKIADRCIAAIVKAEGEIPSQVIIAADWNAKPGHSLFKPLRRAGLRLTQAAQKVPSLGRRGIDGFVWRQTGGLQFVDQRGVRTSSDHKAVVARWHVSKR